MNLHDVVAVVLMVLLAAVLCVAAYARGRRDERRALSPNYDVRPLLKKKS